MSKLNALPISTSEEMGHDSPVLLMQELFGDYPFDVHNCSVDERLRTEDENLMGMAAAMKEAKGGFMAPTATSKAQGYGLQSAAGLTRTNCNVWTVHRQTLLRGPYKRNNESLRYLGDTIGYIKEPAVPIVLPNGCSGGEYKVTVNYDWLPEYGELAMKMAREKNLTIVLMFKWTTDAYDRDMLKKAAPAWGVFDLIAKNHSEGLREWEYDGVKFQVDLTDYAMSKQPVNVSDEGGKLTVGPNKMIDIVSDCDDKQANTYSSVGLELTRDGWGYHAPVGGTNLVGFLQDPQSHSALVDIHGISAAMAQVNPVLAKDMKAFQQAALIFYGTKGASLYFREAVPVIRSSAQSMLA